MIKYADNAFLGPLLAVTKAVSDFKAILQEANQLLNISESHTLMDFSGLESEAIRTCRSGTGMLPNHAPTIICAFTWTARTAFHLHIKASRYLAVQRAQIIFATEFVVSRNRT
jgi:hypothetical protein